MRMIVVLALRFGVLASTTWLLTAFVGRAAYGVEPSDDGGPVLLEVGSTRSLRLPPISTGPPAPGVRVLVTPPEYAGTDVYHSVYLPKSWSPHWKRRGRRLPVIFEYTGNWFPQAGSTGQVKDAGLGYGLSAGKYIWVVLPFIRTDGRAIEVTWWGDVAKTVEYAKANVPRIMDQFGGDWHAVFLCGFSRGAVAVNFIGLHDDKLARLWTAFITHDHFDGARAWPNTMWGWPLASYRERAVERLRRVGDRPYLVIQNGKSETTEGFIRSALPAVDNFTFLYIDTQVIFGRFPNGWAKAAHTDRWPLRPSPYRRDAWKWINRVVEK